MSYEFVTRAISGTMLCPSVVCNISIFTGLFLNMWCISFLIVVFFPSMSCLLQWNDPVTQVRNSFSIMCHILLFRGSYLQQTIPMPEHSGILRILLQFQSSFVPRFASRGQHELKVQLSPKTRAVGTPLLSGFWNAHFIGSGPMHEQF